MFLLSSMTSLQARKRWLTPGRVVVGMMFLALAPPRAGVMTAVREREVSQT
jgi:hypothetical protein